MDIPALWQSFTDQAAIDHYETFIQQHGAWFYALTFLWTFLEGETFVILAGAAAARGVLDIRLLVLVAWLGSFCGDQMWYYLGKRFGTALLNFWPKLQPGAKKVSTLILKYDVIFILTYRFIYGLRNVSSIAIGMSGLEWRKFALWNSVAALIWALSFSLGGYFFAATMKHFIGDADSFMPWVLAGIALLVALKWIWEKVKKTH